MQSVSKSHQHFSQQTTDARKTNFEISWIYFHKSDALLEETQNFKESKYYNILSEESERTLNLKES